MPFVALLVVAWQVWADLLFWSDLVVFTIMYVITGLGVTVGFHRLFTHRSFKAGNGVRATFAVFGSMAPAFASQDNPTPAQAPNLTGLHDFDMRAGEWRAHHRRLKERLANNHEWEEFDGTCSFKILMGGYAPPVLRRTVRLADGWYGWGLDLEETERYVTELRRLEAELGRPEELGELREGGVI